MGLRRDMAENRVTGVHSVARYVRHHHLAMLALFVALGGVGYAAVKLPANSVTSRTVKNRSLKRKDFKPNQLPAGEQGPPGEPGAPGSPAQTYLGGSFDPAEGNVAATRSPIGNSADPSAPIAPSGHALVLSDLTVRVSNAPGGANSRQLKLYLIDDPNQFIGCTVTGAATTCNTGTATLTVPAGQRFGLFEQAGTSPTPASELSFGYLLQPAS